MDSHHNPIISLHISIIMYMVLQKDNTGRCRRYIFQWKLPVLLDYNIRIQLFSVYLSLIYRLLSSAAQVKSDQDVVSLSVLSQPSSGNVIGAVLLKWREL